MDVGHSALVQMKRKQHSGTDSVCHGTREKVQCTHRAHRKMKNRLQSNRGDTSLQLPGKLPHSCQAECAANPLLNRRVPTHVFSDGGLRFLHSSFESLLLSKSPNNLPINLHQGNGSNRHPCHCFS